MTYIADRAYVDIICNSKEIESTVLDDCQFPASVILWPRALVQIKVLSFL